MGIKLTTLALLHSLTWALFSSVVRAMDALYELGAFPRDTGSCPAKTIALSKLFSLPTLLYAGYSVKLILFFFTRFHRMVTWHEAHWHSCQLSKMREEFCHAELHNHLYPTLHMKMASNWKYNVCFSYLLTFISFTLYLLSCRVEIWNLGT